MNFLQNSGLNTLRFAYRKKRLDTKSSVLSTYRYSVSKPQKISSGKFELFYRPRMIWTLMQIVALSAVTVWTIRNYVHIIKSL